VRSQASPLRLAELVPERVALALTLDENPAKNHNSHKPAEPPGRIAL
jgi:hypothetical protein